MSKYTFKVTLKDSLDRKILLHVEANSLNNLQVFLESIFKNLGCEIISVEQKVQ